NLGVDSPTDVAPASDAPARAFAATMLAFWRSVAALDEAGVEGLATNTAILTRFQTALTRSAADVIKSVPSDQRAQVARLREFLERETAKDVERRVVDGFAAWKAISSTTRESVEVATTKLDGAVADETVRQVLRTASLFLSAVAAKEKIVDK